MIILLYKQLRSQDSTDKNGFRIDVENDTDYCQIMVKEEAYKAVPSGPASAEYKWK